MKRPVVFDLDGTLAPSKSSLEAEIAALLGRLLGIVKAAIISSGGAASIDVTRPGIHKAYGIKKLKETLGVPIADMIFVGDAIFPGGNDDPAKQAGVESIRVRDPDETKRVIEAICACLKT